MTVYIPEATGPRTAREPRGERRRRGRVRGGPDAPDTVQVKGRSSRSGRRPTNERASSSGASGILPAVEAGRCAAAVLTKKNRWPCRAVTFDVTEVFEQTPGPRAGRRRSPRGPRRDLGLPSLAALLPGDHPGALATCAPRRDAERHLPQPDPPTSTSGTSRSRASSSTRRSGTSRRTRARRSTFSTRSPSRRTGSSASATSAPRRTGRSSTRWRCGSRSSPRTPG